MKPLYNPTALVPDRRPIYRPWCLIMGHRWEREAYVYPPEWTRRRSCRRCRNVKPPR